MKRLRTLNQSGFSTFFALLGLLIAPHAVALDLDFGIDFLRESPRELIHEYFTVFNHFDQAYVGTNFDFSVADSVARERGMQRVGRIDKKYIVIERCSKNIPSDLAVSELNKQLQKEMRSQLTAASGSRIAGIVQGMFTKNRNDVMQGRVVRMLAGATRLEGNRAVIEAVPLEFFFVQMPYGSCKYASYWLRAEAQAYRKDLVIDLN